MRKKPAITRKPARTIFTTYNRRRSGSRLAFSCSIICLRSDRSARRQTHSLWPTIEARGTASLICIKSCGNLCRTIVRVRLRHSGGGERVEAGSQRRDRLSACAEANCDAASPQEVAEGLGDGDANKPIAAPFSAQRVECAA